MASYLRIKRRLEEEPAEALLLARSSKKFKEDSNENPNVFKFFGTIDSKDGDVQTINRLLEDKKMKSYRTKSAPNKRKITKPKASYHSGNRYTVTSTFSNVNEGASESDLKVYDLVREGESNKNDTIMCNGVPMVVETCAAETKQDVFVYDYYYSEVGTIDDSYLDQLMSVQPVEYKYESSESEEDSEDSNAEGNYKNDYPDTEESCEDDLDYENLMGATSRINLRDSIELSDDDEDLIYDDDNTNPHYSTAYAKYKKRVLKELNGETGSDSEDSEEGEDFSENE